MMKQEQTNKNHALKDDFVDLRELFDLLWEGRKLIISITCVFALCSIIVGLSLNNYYKSEAILTLAEGQSELSALSRFGGIASMAGINIPGGGEDKGALITNTIRSRAFLNHLLSVENILPSIMVAESYDRESKKIVFDSNIYDVANNKWLETQPTYLEAYEEYMEQLDIYYNPTTRLITISIVHLSPVFAKEFLELIIDEADALIRQKDLQQSSDALKYLTSEISKTSLIEMKSSINQLIQTQLETQMMAKISSNYILYVIEPAFIPEKKLKPSRLLICLSVTIIGCVLSILWILIRHFALNEKSIA